jgi:hypothetical protein
LLQSVAQLYRPTFRHDVTAEEGQELHRLERQGDGLRSMTPAAQLQVSPYRIQKAMAHFRKTAASREEPDALS